MSDTPSILKRATSMAIFLLPLGSLGQSLPTASQRLQLSTFLAATRTSTNLQGGENLDVTSGTNLALLTFRQLDASVELRGSYPIQRGSISSQQSFLLGPKVQYPTGSLRPYIDFLVGRGRISYLNGGYIFGDIKYIRSDSLVLSPGIGLDIYLTHRTALKVDLQYQTWETPAVASGRITPLSVTVGAAYNFDFNSRHRE